jgi:N-dimethylarginine dimethylaminohydrolase
VDRTNAVRQWNALRETFERIGLDVHVVPTDARFPDMVFCANQTFPFGDRRVLMSRMHAPERRGEVDVLREAFRALGYATLEITHGTFEGSGDLVRDQRRIFAGHGFRTDARVLDDVATITGEPLVRLRLIDARFYHLDTCLAVLGRGRAAYVRCAFDEESASMLRSSFETLVEIDEEEAERKLACNLFCPDGENVVIQSGCVRTNAALERLGLRVHEVDTSEFLKSGGSVFCLKQVLV